MLNVVLFQFEKRKNSTKVPNLNDGTTMQGEVKNDFSPLAPVISFNLANPNIVPVYNYAYVQAFGGRYYFITDWLYVAGLWRATMAVDVLATYRVEILNSTQYVARSKTHKNGALVDGAYPTLAGAEYTTTTVNQRNIWGADYGAGCFILGTIAYSGANVGAITYYAMSWLCLQYLMQEMLQSPNWMNISTSEISEDLQKALINPLQYVVSCVWIPARWEDFIYYQSPTFDSDLSKEIRLGWWSFQLPTGEGTGEYTVRRLHNPTSPSNPDKISASFALSIPKHPQAPTRGDWLNLSPTTKYTLEFLPFGVFDIDTTDLKNAASIRCDVEIHAYTGDATLHIFIDNTNNCILTESCNFAIPIPIGQVRLDLSNYKQAVAAGAAAGVSEVASMATASMRAARSSPSPHSTTTRGG